MTTSETFGFRAKASTGERSNEIRLRVWLLMTKKSKKKAIKTGSRHIDKPGLILSVNLQLNLSDKDNSKGDLDRRKSFYQQKKKVKKNKHQVPQEEETERLSYPFDLWFHVGRFIAPDQVKTFALICCACWKVTHTSYFWLSLYKRFVRDTGVLPFRLQSDNIDSGPGLQSKVKSAIGMILTSFNSCMSTDMRYHQIKTIFHYEGTARSYNKNDGMHMCFNPVIDVNILPWWNPSYPYHEE
eukprot:gene8779-14809_t